MRVALVGAELEENLGLRYMASALERNGHQTEIVPFKSEHDTASAVRQIAALVPIGGRGTRREAGAAIHGLGSGTQWAASRDPAFQLRPRYRVGCIANPGVR